MAITVRGTSTADSGGVAVTSLNITVPATVQDGDVGYLIADTANTSRTGVAPSGWTMVGGTHYSATGLRSWLYRRDLTSALAGTTVTVGISGTGVITAGMIVFAGASAASEVIVGATTDLGDNTTMATVAVTPSANDSLLIHLASVRYTSLTTSGGTAPTGFTEVFDYDNGATGGTNGRHGVYCATKQLTGQAGVSQTSVNGTWASTARDNTWGIALGPGASQLPASGTVAGTSAISGASTLRAATAGAVAAVTVAAGAAGALLGASGAAPAVSSVSGSASVITAASGSVTATSTTSATAVRTAPASGAVTGTSAAIGAATSRQAASGSVAGVSGVSGSANIIGGTQQLPASGAVAGTSAVTGSAGLRAASSGAVAATSTVSGAAILRAATSGVVAATSSVTAAPKLRAAASGSLAATSAITGSARLLAPVGGIVAALSDTSGTAFATYVASGSVDAVSGTSGSADNAGAVIPTDVIAGPAHDPRQVAGPPNPSTYTPAKPAMRHATTGPVPIRHSAGRPR